MSKEVIRVAPGDYDYTAVYRQYGNGVYLADGETFESVVAHDAAILTENGVTQEEVGDSLRLLFNTLNTFLPSRGPIVNEPIPGVVLTRQVFSLGQERSPFISAYSNIDWRVHTSGLLSNGNKAYHPISGPTIVSDMLPEMIKERGFFKGDVFYGIQPEWAVAVHAMVKKYKPEPYVPTFTNEAWDCLSAWPGTNRPFHDIAMSHDRAEWFLPGVYAFIAPGSIAPHDWDRYTGEPQFTSKYDDDPNRKVVMWALLIAEQETAIPPDAQLAGYPLGMHCNKVSEGLSYVRFFPHYEKQVG